MKMKTKIYVLQKNNELWKGEVDTNRTEEQKIVAVLSSKQETVDDIIEGVKSQDFPWNFDYYDNIDLKVETSYSKKDFGFVHVEDLDLKQMTPKTLVGLGKRIIFRDTTLFEHRTYYWSEEDAKILFIDLQHRKAFCLGFDDREGYRTFPKDLRVPSYTERIRDTTKMSTPPPRVLFIEKTIPSDFTPITIEFLNSDQELQVATELLRQLRECNHPSSTFFRSLGACIDQNFFWEVSMEGVEWRPATPAEFKEHPSFPERIREDYLPLKGRIVRHIPKVDVDWSID
jgi:hypothetical protein